MSRRKSNWSIVGVAAWMVLAVLCFCLLAIASRELTVTMATLEILFWRSLFGFLLVSFLLTRSGGLPEIFPDYRQLVWHLLRNSSHFGGQCAWLSAIAVLPMAEVFALEFTAPFWAALLAATFMAEPLSRGRVLSLLIGLAGIVVILQPGGAAAVHPASLVMLAGALGFGISIIATRKLTLILHGQRHAYLLILFFMTGMQMLFSLVPTANHFSMPTAGELPWLLVAAVTALSAHYCLSRALSLADAAVVMPIDYLRLPVIMLAAWLIYGEAVSLSLLLGSALIIMGNVLGLYVETIRRQRQQGKISPL